MSSSGHYPAASGGAAKPISKRLRFEIYRRDNHTCRYCGASAPDAKLTVDHVIPVTLGGTDEPSNLVTACADCNSGKSSIAPDSPIVEDVAEDTLRWARAMAEAAAMQTANLKQQEEFITRVDGLWRAANPHERHYPRPDDWPDSVERLYNAGLELDVIEYAIKVTMRQANVPFDRLWRYFCGICWRRLNERQNLAMDIVRQDAA